MGGGRWRPVGIVAGMVLTFSVVTLVGSSLLSFLGLPRTSCATWASPCSSCWAPAWWSRPGLSGRAPLRPPDPHRVAGSLTACCSGPASGWCSSPAPVPSWPPSPSWAPPTVSGSSRWR